MVQVVHYFLTVQGYQALLVLHQVLQHPYLPSILVSLELQGCLEDHDFPVINQQVYIIQIHVDNEKHANSQTMRQLTLAPGDPGSPANPELPRRPFRPCGPRLPSAPGAP